MLMANMNDIAYQSAMLGRRRPDEEISNIVMDRVEAIGSYIVKNDIKNVILGLSGGVDSALVLALLVKVKEVIKDLQIHTITIGFEQYKNVFENDYVQIIVDRFRDLINHQDISMTNSENSFLGDMGLKPNPSAQSNINYAMRYLALFAYSQTVNGIVFGTTNYDEMSYVGWFGKHSDMNVDVQPISKLSKPIVIQCAQYLGVPDAVCNRKPSGDLINLKTDEDEFGVTYAELGAYVKLINEGFEFSFEVVEKFKHVEALRKKNLHKYQGQTYNPIFI